MIAALLSHKMVVGPSDGILMPHNRVHNHTHYFAALNPAVYSALHDEAATIFCLHVFHEITPEPSENA